MKDAKLKVDSQINGDKLRVTGKKRDDLQAAMALLRAGEFERAAAVRQLPRLIAMDAVQVEVDVRRWLERAVIGLNLCPFAKAVYVKNQVRLVVSDASTASALLEQLGEELVLLRDTPTDQVDTTLLVHPQVLGDFLDYNDFLDDADALVEALALDGVLQVASFHPDYQFAGTAPDDAENLTNRAPYPTLHLLREDSVARAVDAYPEPDAIIERNVATMRELGIDGFRKLLSADTEE